MTDQPHEAGVPEDVKALAGRALSNAAVASQHHILDVGHDEADNVVCEAVVLAIQQAIMADRSRRSAPETGVLRADQPLTVGIEEQQLVIRIGFDVLAHAIRYAPSLSHFDGTVSDDVLEPTITDADTFFKELVIALNSEEEDGTTPVHRMLDAAALAAIESGAEGIETGWDKADKLRAALTEKNT